MGPELDEQGWVKNAFKVNWVIVFCKKKEN